jgi:hypothetical protein
MSRTTAPQMANLGVSRQYVRYPCEERKNSTCFPSDLRLAQGKLENCRHRRIMVGLRHHIFSKLDRHVCAPQAARPVRYSY